MKYVQGRFSFGYSEWPTSPLGTRVFKVTAAFLLGLPVEFRWFAQCALSEEGTLKVDKLDRLRLLHIHRNQSKVRTTLRSLP
jgi:hypothetical protein